MKKHDLYQDCIRCGEINFNTKTHLALNKLKALIFRRDLIKFAFLSLQIEIEIASWKVSIHFIKIKCQEQYRYIFFIKEKNPDVALLRLLIYYMFISSIKVAHL